MSGMEVAGPAEVGADFVSEIAGLKTQFDMFRFLRRVTEAYGARGFMVINLPSSTSTELSNNSVITNWPAELLSLYDKETLLPESPVIRRLRKATVPFVYDLELMSSERSEKSRSKTRDLFTRFNLQRGGFFPVHDPSGARGGISFSGERECFNRQEMMELMYVSVHVFDRLAEIRDMDVKPADALTERELDCLNWTAAGKTSAEIAEILSLSEHTVNHYLNRATKKLNTVNRTQAVAKALRIGLIK